MTLAMQPPKRRSDPPARPSPMRTAPIALIERGPLILMVPPNSPFKSVKDIIAAAKAKPGSLSYASGGLGGSHHLSAEMFKSIAGLFITHIPYKGGAPATTDLMGGQVDMMFEQLYSASPSIKAGKLRALAITSKTRSPLFPDLPTMVEAGVPGFESQNWQGLVGPAGMPTSKPGSKLNFSPDRRVAGVAGVVLRRSAVIPDAGDVDHDVRARREHADQLLVDRTDVHRAIGVVGLRRVDEHVTAEARAINPCGPTQQAPQYAPQPVYPFASSSR